jgi:hypothetical protein
MKLLDAIIKGVIVAFMLYVALTIVGWMIMPLLMWR